MLAYDCLKCDNCQLCRPLAKTLGEKFQCPSSTAALVPSTAVREERPGPETRPAETRPVAADRMSTRKSRIPETRKHHRRPSVWNIFVGIIRKGRGASARFKDMAKMYACWTSNGRFPDEIKDLETEFKNAIAVDKTFSNSRTRIGYKKRLPILPPEGVPFTIDKLPGRRDPWVWFLYKAVKKGDVKRFGRERFIRISKTTAVTAMTAPKGAKATKKRLSFNDRTAALPEEFKTKDLPGPFIARRCFLYRAKRKGLVEMMGSPCGVNTKWRRIHTVPPVPPAEKAPSASQSYLRYNDCLAMLPEGDFRKKDLPHPPKDWDYFLARAYKKGDVERNGKSGSKNTKWRRTSPTTPRTVPIDYFCPPEEPGVEPPNGQTAAASPDKPGEKAPLQKRTRKSSAPRTPNPRISIPDLGKHATYDQRLAAIPTEWFTDADLPGGIKRWYPFLYKARARGDVECQHRKWRKIPPPAAPVGRPRGRKNTSPKERYNTLPDGLFSLKDLPGNKKYWLSYINRVVKLGLVLKHIDGRHIRYERVVKKPDIPLACRVEDSANGRMMEELRRSDPTK